MMSNHDPDAGEFGRLLDDIWAVQQRRAASAPVHRAIQRHGIMPGEFTKSLRQADTRRAATAAELARAVADIERLAAENRKLAQAQIGEKRARLRQQAADLLRRAMIGLGRGEITAIEVAGIEARVNRFLAELDQQSASVPVRARVVV